MNRGELKWRTDHTPRRPALTIDETRRIIRSLVLAVDYRQYIPSSGLPLMLLTLFDSPLPGDHTPRYQTIQHPLE